MEKKNITEEFLKQPIAHRGLHNDMISENSLEAFKKALEYSYSIEIDIRKLRDDKLVIVHDSNIKRVTGFDIVVEQITSSELEKYPLMKSNENIPLFLDFLNLIDGKTNVLIEIKTVKKYKKVCDLLLENLKSYKHKETIALQSFDPRIVRYLKKKTNEFSVGLLACKNYNNLSKFKKWLLSSLLLLHFSHADFISYNIDDLPNKKIDKIVKKGYRLLVWTVDSIEKLVKSKKNNVSQIIFEKINLER